MQLIDFKEQDNLEHVPHLTHASRTMLTKCFANNRSDPNARKWLYAEYLEHYIWNAKHDFYFLTKNIRKYLLKLTNYYVTFHFYP